MGKERGREERREGRRVRRKRGKEGEREEEGREWCVKGRTALLQRTLQVKSFMSEQELIKKNVSNYNSHITTGPPCSQAFLPQKQLARLTLTDFFPFSSSKAEASSLSFSGVCVCVCVCV